jgi:cysteine desulfurase/selenocysteine lyase
LGTTNDVKTICSIAHKVGAKVLIDAAQSIAHQKIDVTDLDCDFLAFSGHKLFGPTGIGILYGKKKLLQEAKPFMFGGSMVFTAGYEDSFWKNAPYCFEAGTAPIAQAIGLAAAITYIQNHIDFDWLQEHENMLVQKSVFGILESGMKLLSPATAGKHNHLVTFYHPTIHAHDIAMYLDVYCNIAVRAGNHCVQPYHEKKDIEATVRASFALYNTEKEVDQFVRALKTIQ